MPAILVNPLPAARDIANPCATTLIVRIEKQCHIAAPVVAFATGWGIEYLILWPLPLVTVLQPILRFRAICEHGGVTDYSSALTAARTNLGPFWLRWLLFPHHVHYHVEHHIYPAIPHYNLPECHREMVARGLLEGAEVRPFWSTVKRVVADPPAEAKNAA